MTPRIRTRPGSAPAVVVLFACCMSRALRAREALCTLCTFAPPFNDDPDPGNVVSCKGGAAHFSDRAASVPSWKLIDETNVYERLERQMRRHVWRASRPPSQETPYPSSSGFPPPSEGEGQGAGTPGI